MINISACVYAYEHRYLYCMNVWYTAKYKHIESTIMTGESKHTNKGMNWSDESKNFMPRKW